MYASAGESAKRSKVPNLSRDVTARAGKKGRKGKKKKRKRGERRKEEKGKGKKGERGKGARFGHFLVHCSFPISKIFRPRVQ